MRLIVCIVAVLSTLPEVSPHEGLVVLSCSISDDWLQRTVDASPKRPRPTKDDLRAFLAGDGLADIELSFDAGKDGAGAGMLIGKIVPNYVTGQYVMYFTADDEGAPNSVLDRHSGTLVMPVGGGIPDVTYSCEQRERKF